MGKSKGRELQAEAVIKEKDVAEAIAPDWVTKAIQCVPMDPDLRMERLARRRRGGRQASRGMTVVGLA